MFDSADELTERLKTAVEAWDALEWPRPEVAVVSGSGLAVELGEVRRGPLDLSYFLPFAAHDLAGHPHQVDVIEARPGRLAVYFRGRLHAYQGYSAAETVFPVRLAAQLGAKVLLLTNASGSLDETLRPGELALVADHLNLTGLNPLRGQLPAEWGPRFPDMGGAYDPRLRALAQRLAAGGAMTAGEGGSGASEGGSTGAAPLPECIYAGLLGPSYETPAEVRMLRQLGAGLVGMSTVLEIIAARQLGMACLCIALVSNPAAGLAVEALTHEDVLVAAAGGAERLQRLLRALLASDELLV